MIFYRSYNNRGVWIGTQEVDLTILKTNGSLFSVVSIAFDEITRKLWAFFYSKDNKFICFYNIDNGIVDLETGIFIERPKKFYPCEQIYNNKILFTVDSRNYEIIDLITQKQETFMINDIDGMLPMGYPQNPLGFSDDKVLFRNGYYSIVEDEYYFFNNLKYPRFVTREEKVIGLNNENFIVIYDLNNKTIWNTNIKRTLLKYSKYDGSDLYFLEDDKLFFSKDIKGLDRIFDIFLPIGYSRREWYVYDLQEHELNKINTPTDMVILLGSYASSVN
jgi:hypothetical protein